MSDKSGRVIVVVQKHTLLLTLCFIPCVVQAGVYVCMYHLERREYTGDGWSGMFFGGVLGYVEILCKFNNRSTRNMLCCSCGGCRADVSVMKMLLVVVAVAWEKLGFFQETIRFRTFCESRALYTGVFFGPFPDPVFLCFQGRCVYSPTNELSF